MAKPKAPPNAVGGSNSLRWLGVGALVKNRVLVCAGMHPAVRPLRPTGASRNKGWRYRQLCRLSRACSKSTVQICTNGLLGFNVK